MTATVHDLLSARAERGRLRFADDVDALDWITSELTAIAAENADQLLVPTEPLSERLARLSVVSSAVADLYRAGHREDSR